jgi:hypothetical protein
MMLTRSVAASGPVQLTEEPYEPSPAREEPLRTELEPTPEEALLAD